MYMFRKGFIMKSIDFVRKVAIYARRSQGEELSVLEKHLFDCENICKKHGWDYVIYKEIESGDSIAERPVMQDLLDDVREKIYDAVIVTYYDRLGRGSGTDQDTIFSTFLNSDTLIIETTPFNVYNMEDDASEELIAFKQFMARREYKMITKRMNYGRKMALEMGRWVYNVPYGYTFNKTNKKLEINDEEAKVCRMIFDWYLSRKYSIAAIVKELNLLQIPSPKGNLWGESTVTFILKSEMYLGHLIYNKSLGNRYSKSVVAKKYKRNPVNEWKKKENVHEAIKTKEEHEKILKIISENNKRGHGTNSINILTGIVKCFNCNSTIKIKTNKHGQKKLSNCTKCNIGRGGDTRLVIDAIYLELNNLKEKLANSILVNEFEKDKLLDEIKQYKKKIEIDKEKIKQVEDAYEYGLYNLIHAREIINGIKSEVLNNLKIISDRKEKLEEVEGIKNKKRIQIIENVLKDMKMNEGDTKKQNAILKSIIKSIKWKNLKIGEIEIDVEVFFDFLA